jgi:hypothetical protein
MLGRDPITHPHPPTRTPTHTHIHCVAIAHPHLVTVHTHRRTHITRSTHYIPTSAWCLLFELRWQSTRIATSIRSPCSTYGFGHDRTPTQSQDLYKTEKSWRTHVRAHAHTHTHTHTHDVQCPPCRDGVPVPIRLWSVGDDGWGQRTHRERGSLGAMCTSTVGTWVGSMVDMVQLLDGDDRVLDRVLLAPPLSPLLSRRHGTTAHAMAFGGSAPCSARNRDGDE